MNKAIKKLRNIINETDKNILEKLSKRMAVVRLIGKIKTARGLAVSDKKREKEMENLRGQWAKELGLNRKLVEKIFKLIIKEAKKIQV